MKFLKLTFKLLAILLLTTASFCDDEEVEYTCEECIAAQAELCSALGASNCDDSSSVNSASDKVRKRCDDGSGKVVSLQNGRFFGENDPDCSSFSCN